MPSKAILVNEPCYSDWQLGAIQIDLTPLTLLISEDSAKQLMINPLFTGISMIGLLGEGNVFYVSPAHSEILILLMGNTYLGRMCFKQILKEGKSRGRFWVC